MQENNQKDTEGKETVPPTEKVAESSAESVTPVEPASTEVVVESIVTATDVSTPSVAATDSVAVAADATTTTTAPIHSGSMVRTYALAGLAIVVMGLGLLFVLEQQGRVSTGLFSAFLSPKDSAVALVNDVEILSSDYESGVNQLLQMAADQGADVTDAALIAQYQTQALDTLVNGELLRQAALAAGMTAPAEEIETRYSEIEASVGGAEALAGKMAEFGITEKTLRRDIENEILIAGLFEKEIDVKLSEVSEADIAARYEELGGEAAGIPPLKDVSEQIAQQIRGEEQQQLIGAYIETLREEATIEILK